jgi:hypothetical protein
MTGGGEHLNKQGDIMDITGKLNPEMQKFLENVCLREGFGTTDKDFAELLSESGEVYSEIGDAHRWYDEKTVVVKIDGKFIQYEGYHLTGDDSASDMGLEFDLSSVQFCEPYEVTVTKYRPLK